MKRKSSVSEVILTQIHHRIYTIIHNKVERKIWIPLLSKITCDDHIKIYNLGKNVKNNFHRILIQIKREI